MMDKSSRLIIQAQHRVHLNRFLLIPIFLSNYIPLLFHQINYIFFCKVVSQPFEAEADNEYVIRGNAAIMKCEVPSFVSDFVYVEMWMDSEGGTYYPSSSEGNFSLGETIP